MKSLRIDLHQSPFAAKPYPASEEIAMQTGEMSPAVAAITEAGAAEGGEIDRRIEGLRQVRALCGRLAPARERHYADVMTAAAAPSDSGSARMGALLELDLLSLELCDD